MRNHLHHVHIFAADIERSLRFYRELFDGEVVLDLEVAGARNVFVRIGTGRLHLYAQAPTRPGRGSIHHFGIQTDVLDEMATRLTAAGVDLGKGIRDAGVFRYLMVPAPDEVLIELFEVDRSRIPAELLDWFA